MRYTYLKVISKHNTKHTQPGFCLSCAITYAEATIVMVNPSHQTSPTCPLQPHLHSHADPRWPGLTLPTAPVRFTVVRVPVTGTNRAEGRGRERLEMHPSPLPPLSPMHPHLPCSPSDPLPCLTPSDRRQKPPQVGSTSWSLLRSQWPYVKT